MPRLKRPPQLEPNAVVHHLPQLREAELPQGLKPVALEGKSTSPQIVQHAVKIGHQEMGQEKLVVQRRSPAHQRAVPGTLPHCCHQRPHNELREQADPHMRGHLKGAQFHQPPLAAGSVGGKELVDAEFCPVGVAGQIDQQVAEHPIDKPWGNLRAGGPQFLQRDLQFVEAFMTSFVDAGRLAGGADERAGKEIRERRVVVPIGHQARQQVGPPQKGTVGRSGPAEHQMVAAAGAGVLAIHGKFFGTQPAQSRLGIDRFAQANQF